MAEPDDSRFVTYQDADPDLKAAMDRLIAPFERNPDSKLDFGAEELRRYQASVDAIEKLLEDPAASRDARHKLQQTYLQAARDVGMVLGAGGEVLRRYEEVYITEAQKSFAESRDPEDENYLGDVNRRYQELDARLSVTASAEKSGAQAVFSAGLAQGLSLEEPLSVRRFPLRLLRPGVRA